MLKKMLRNCMIFNVRQGICELKVNWAESYLQGLNKFGTAVSLVMLKRYIELEDDDVFVIFP